MDPITIFGILLVLFVIAQMNKAPDPAVVATAAADSATRAGATPDQATAAGAGAAAAAAGEPTPPAPAPVAVEAPAPAEVEAPAPPTYSWDIRPFSDFRGNDISCGRYSRLRDIKQACINNPHCKGFSYRNGRPWCMKHALPRRVSDRTHHFYKLVRS